MPINNKYKLDHSCLRIGNPGAKAGAHHPGSAIDSGLSVSPGCADSEY